MKDAVHNRVIANPRRGILAMSGLLLFIFLSTCGLLVAMSERIDDQELAHEREDVARSFESAISLSSTIVADYSFWGDAYRNLHPEVDMEWAYNRHNISSGLYKDYGFNGVFIIGPNDHTHLALIDGELSQVDARSWMQGSFAELLAQARERTEEKNPVVALMTVDGAIALVAASPITRGSDEATPLVPGPPSVMIFATILNEAALNKIGHQFGMNDLRVIPPGETYEANYDLVLGDRHVSFTWEFVEPGEHLLAFILPPLAISGLLFSVLASIFSRWALRAAKKLKQQYIALEHSQGALIASESRFKDIAESSSDWIWEIDAELRITYLSERFETVTGHLAQHWIGQPLDALFISQANLFGWMHADDNRYWDVQQREYLAKNGETRICRISARKMPGDNSGYRGTATDITDEVAARARIEHMAMHDNLTGLANRTAMQAFLDGKLKTEVTLSEPLVMLCMDLDRFKPINDALGHAAGDQVLNEVSRRLQVSVREGDLVARQGGDEFVLLVSGMTQQREIEALCQRLIHRIEEPFHVNSTEVFISCSIGIAIAPNDSTHAHELLRFADIALYEAKGAGRRTWCFYDKGMNERIRERRQLEAELRQAITNQELRLVFQPRYMSDGQTIAGAEALIRWQHPQLGMMSPDKFIPIAEETGLIFAITDWVMQTACAQVRQWGDERFVSVNVSPVEFRQSDLVGRVRTALTDSGIPASRLELELTESVLMEDADSALLLMNQLKELGVRLAIDDFGTGYSSLSYLLTFPFDGLKIDKSFLVSSQSEEHENLFEAIVGVGRALSLTVTAEGVETLEQLEMLRQAGCHEAQGYYLSRPIAPDAMKRLVEQAPQAQT